MKKSNIYNELIGDANHPIRKKIHENFIAKLVARDERSIENPESMYAIFRNNGIEPCNTSDGQFCGGIESESYKKDGRIYEFMIEDGIIIDATSIKDIGET